jgi:hypothetical protein
MSECKTLSIVDPASIPLCPERILDNALAYCGHYSRAIGRDAPPLKARAPAKIGSRRIPPRKQVTARRAEILPYEHDRKAGRRACIPARDLHHIQRQSFALSVPRAPSDLLHVLVAARDQRKALVSRRRRRALRRLSGPKVVSAAVGMHTPRWLRLACKQASAATLHWVETGFLREA